MDPRWRLERTFPGEGLAAPSNVAVRVAERDRPLKEPRKELGQLVSVPERSTRRIENVVQASPNAPLLKRLVRYPYALHAVQPRRSTVAEPIPWDALAREPREAVSAVMASVRGERIQGNPLRAVPTRVPRLLPIPTADAWLGGRDE